ncbi:MAG: NnrU family protein [Nitrosomonadaceae bacterium]|nr:NnrU family protein [Nitrosomonadaceae bacterium]
MQQHTLLLVGLVLFLGIHSARIFADDARSRFIAARGELAWKGVYALLSIAGFVLLVYGYAEARTAPITLWQPPVWTRHVAALLTLPAFIMLAAAYIPSNGIKARLKHPMLLGTKTWALAHLLSNGSLADVLLFGGFLVWAVLCFRACRQRDRATGKVYESRGAVRTVGAVAIGVVAWFVFAMYLHAALIGVAPFAR